MDRALVRNLRQSHTLLAAERTREFHNRVDVSSRPTVVSQASQAAA